MDKVRDVIMKLSENSSPKQRGFIEEHLTKFLADFNSPDHPPYAAMIHRALQELNEKGGSTEDSISKYIKNQYADLPWAHNSLLKHHLGNLCDSGEISVTYKKYYLFADANPILDCPIRPKKGHLKRKQKGESRRGQGRQFKKNEAEVCDKQKEEHCEVIGEHNKCNIEQDKFKGEHKEIKEHKVDMVGEHNQVPKLLYEVTEELIESDEQHHEVIGSEAYDQRIEVTRDGGHELRDGRIEGQSHPLSRDVGISSELEQGQPRWQETVISAEQSQPQQKQEGYAICVPLVDSNVQIEHLEKQNQTDLSSPEWPPGFEFATFKELSWSPEQTKDLLDLEQYEVLPNSERLSEIDLPIVKDFSETLQQIKEEEQRRQLKHEGRDPSEFPRSALSTTMMKLFPAKQQQQQPELSNSEVLQEGKSKDLEFLEQNQKPLKQYGRQKQVKSQTKERKAKDVHVDSEHIKQKQQSDLSDPVKSSGLKLTIVESFTSEKQQQLETCGEQEATESQTGAMVPMDPKQLDREEFPDKLVPGSLTELQKVIARHQQEGRKNQYVPIDSEQIKQKQHLDLSDPEKSSALKPTTVESFLTEKQQQQLEICREQQAPEPQSGAILTSSDLYMDAKRLDKEEQPDKSVPAPKPVTAISQTELEQRQVVRHSQRLAKSKQTATSSVDLLPCSQLQDRHLGQPELQDCELPREIKQKPVEESIDIAKQQAKLRSWQKHKTSQPHTDTYSLDSPLKSEQSLLQVEESAQIIEQCAKLRAHQNQKKSQPNTLMNSLDISVTQKQLDESTQIVQQRAKLRSWKKRFTSQSNTETDSLHSPMALEQVELEEQPELPCSEWYKQAEALKDLPRQQQVALAQEKPTCLKLRPRAPKPESEAAASPRELSPSCHQHGREKQPERRDRGRPPKPKPDTVEIQQRQSDYQNLYEQQQTGQRTGGRHPKLTAKAEVIFNTNSPYNSCQEQELGLEKEQEQEQEQGQGQEAEQKPTYRGRGRTIKPKQTTTSTTHFIPSSKQHQRPKCRGLGRPRKMDQGNQLQKLS